MGKGTTVKRRETRRGHRAGDKVISELKPPPPGPAPGAKQSKSDSDNSDDTK